MPTFLDTKCAEGKGTFSQIQSHISKYEVHFQAWPHFSSFVSNAKISSFSKPLILFPPFSNNFTQVCRYNCPDPVCGDSNPGVISTSTYTGPSPPSGYSANQRIDLNNRVYNVDPRNPGGPRPAGLIMDDATLDKLSAPKTDVKTGGRNLVGGPQVGGRRRGGPSPPAQRSPPRAPVFPKIPGLTKRLGDLLAGKAAVNREEGRSLNSRPVLKRLYKREADGQEMADIDMSGIIQASKDILFRNLGSFGMI